jgi:hypothetical protein
MQPLEAHEVYAISPSGGIPTDPSPNARGSAKVYRLLCRDKFISLFEDHGNTATPNAIAESQRVAQEHLRLTGRL